MDCDFCDGTGRDPVDDDDECPNCDGSGIVDEDSDSDDED